ncbi:MAG: hypothetical protein CVV27_20595, partial [Candidatus Melainabacteria bacterium HGW-Melainabacteria-1]
NAELNDPDYRTRHQIKTVRIPMVSILQPVREPPDGIYEQQEVVVATSTMSQQDWARMRVFAWITQVVYYSKALQIPMMLIHALQGVPYQQLLWAFAEGPLPPGCEVLPQLRGFLQAQAGEILAGRFEYTPGADPNSGEKIWMYPDSFATQHLLYSPKLPAFFNEAAALLGPFATELPPGLLAESLAMSLALFGSQHPARQSFSLSLSWNLWDVYQQLLAGEPAELRREAWRFSRRQTATAYTITSELGSAQLSPSLDDEYSTNLLL